MTTTEKELVGKLEKYKKNLETTAEKVLSLDKSKKADEQLIVSLKKEKEAAVTAV